MTASDTTAAARILVIRLGSLADFVQSTGAFAAIRHNHQDAHVTLLTEPLFAALAEASPWFDQVWDAVPDGLGALRDRLALRRRLANGRFDRVYDLTATPDTDRLFRIMRRGHAGRLEWLGSAPGCSHPRVAASNGSMHLADTLAQQLRLAGMAHVPPPSLAWIEADLARFRLPRRYALLLPGGPQSQPERRWPAAHFAALGREIAERDITPVLLATAKEREITAEIISGCRPAIDLTGRASLADFYALAKPAAGAIGNHTGPMHVVAASGTPSLILVSSGTDLAKSAPRGASVTLLRRQHLHGLAVAEVEAALRLR